MIIERRHCRLILARTSQVYGDVVLLLFIVLVVGFHSVASNILGWEHVLWRLQ